LVSGRPLARTRISCDAIFGGRVGGRRARFPRTSVGPNAAQSLRKGATRRKNGADYPSILENSFASRGPTLASTAIITSNEATFPSRASRPRRKMQSRMRLTFYGAAKEVTGSMALLETRSGSLLIDCGLFQGRRAESRRRNRDLPKVLSTADAVLLTHSHLDHSGNLPTLVRRGFRGAIHGTPATRDLSAVMLRDSARIQANDAAYLNRRFAKEPGYRPVVPLYDELDAVRTLDHFVGEPYHRPFEPLPGVRATFLDAGHILGSAQIVLDVREGGVTRRLLFSGDLGRKNLPIIRDPDRPPSNADYLVLESTYGNRTHVALGPTLESLERIVKSAVERRGKIIVPAFAVGRSQELIYALTDLARRGRLPGIPIFVDSPLCVSVTEIFKLHPECFDREVLARLEERDDPFGFDRIQYVQSRAESMALNRLEGPMVIISASGMAEAGRVLHHLQNSVEDERNTVVIVGFMAQHTLGRRLAERKPKVRIFGVERELRARVEVLDGFSAHAGREDLIAYGDAARPRKTLFVVHGEPDQQEPLRAALEARGHRVKVPSRGESFEL
jgi:metallo-beta-lactamase family protein